MSFLFDGANDNINGAFTSTYAQPMTLACHFKGAHPAAIDTYLFLGNNAATDTESLWLRTSASAGASFNVETKNELTRM